MRRQTSRKVRSEFLSGHTCKFTQTHNTTVRVRRLMPVLGTNRGGVLSNSIHNLEVGFTTQAVSFARTSGQSLKSEFVI
ncbi:hypothetical protein BDP27DRAFT_362112 [Rhodocollybia butyracea]|uniref:Uncharacterized protein n=1 Tax=Rhodocollybia butyracea TaxID=206335 RepID=A0A9P5PDW0_9AGAR|nr:hypothetical protein BDP27DRAFT_362112 [Rhodocollybia butyracea]